MTGVVIISGAFGISGGVGQARLADMSTADSAVLNMTVTGNATGQDNGTGFRFDGIAFRKEGNTATPNSFGIVGMSPSPGTDSDMETYLRSQNPADLLGTGGGGALINTHGANPVWTSCTLTF
jgi:hypothetical protein